MQTIPWKKALKGEKTTARVLAASGLLAAMSVVLARLVSLMPDATARYSLEDIPILLAGILFGPLPGALVGFVADAVGCLFSPFGYNPLFALPRVLIGACAGALRWLLWRKLSLWRVVLLSLPGFLLGSVLWQSYWMAAIYGRNTFLWYLGSRSVQYAVTMLVDDLAVFALLKSRAFAQLKLWPPRGEDEA